MCKSGGSRFFHILRTCVISYSVLEFLPARIARCLDYLNRNALYELRVRAGKPLSVNYAGEFSFLGEHGLCAAGEALLPTLAEIGEIVRAACGYSVYAAENQLKQGFVTAQGGARIGLAGDFVYERGEVHAVRDVTSLCIRVPHEIRGCAEEIYARCLADKLRSVLILAPPGEGKTTILRDLCRLVSARRHVNLLVSDERGELSAGDLGETSDVIRFADKLTAFTAGIRALRPDVIATDELLPADYPAAERAICANIKVFASAHLARYADVPAKIFARYVILDGLGRVGEIVDGEGEGVD